ncbi:MAG: hypothetical protein WBG01_17590 [Bacteroidota bacterium]
MDWLTMSLGVLSGGLAGAIADYIGHARKQHRQKAAEETRQFIAAKSTWERSAKEDWEKLWREHMSGVLKTGGGAEWWKGVHSRFQSGTSNSNDETLPGTTKVKADESTEQAPKAGGLRDRIIRD